MSEFQHVAPRSGEQSTVKSPAFDLVKRRLAPLVMILIATLLTVSCATAPDRNVAAPLATATQQPSSERNFPPMPAGSQVLLPAGTVISLALDRELNTKKLVRKEGFNLTVTRDVVLDDMQVIARGTRGYGEVIHTQKAGTFGKAAELLLTVRWVEVNRQRVPMRHFRPQTGRSRENAVMAMSFVPIVWAATPFIRGSNIVLPAGTLVDAQVAEATTIFSSISTDPKPAQNQELTP